MIARARTKKGTIGSLSGLKYSGVGPYVDKAGWVGFLVVFFGWGFAQGLSGKTTR